MRQVVFLTVSAEVTPQFGVGRPSCDKSSLTECRQKSPRNSGSDAPAATSRLSDSSHGRQKSPRNSGPDAPAATSRLSDSSHGRQKSPRNSGSDAPAATSRLSDSSVDGSHPAIQGRTPQLRQVFLAECRQKSPRNSGSDAPVATSRL